MNRKYNELVCPISKFPLKHEGDMLICTNCSAGFKIIDSIPGLLIEDIILPSGVKDISELKCFSGA